jgi:hypothetical protein
MDIGTSLRPHASHRAEETRTSHGLVRGASPSRSIRSTALATMLVVAVLGGTAFYRTAQPGSTASAAAQATPEAGQAHDLEANKALVLRYQTEVWDKGNTDVVYEVLAPDFTWHFAISEIFLVGPDAVKQHAENLGAQIEGMGLTVDKILAEGDQVAIRWTLTSTAAATPDVTTILCTGNDIYRVEDGQLAEVWNETASCD